MAKRHLIPLFSALALIAWAVSATAQTTQFSLELGYQWLDISGNKDMYRSQVNEDDGFVLRDFALTSNGAGPGGLYDRLRVNASGFGGSPQGRFTLEAGLARAYSLRVAYRRANHFSALPGLANPFLGNGIVPGQHMLDRISTSLDVNLELLPGRTLTPLLGYRWYELGGPGRTTYSIGQDDFLLSSDFQQTIHEVFGGVAFNIPSFHATAIYGQRSVDSTDMSTLALGAGTGNSARPVLGRDIKLDSYERHSRTEGTSPFTNLSFTARLCSRARWVGSYVRSSYEAELSERESAGGSLVSFSLSRFFGGVNGNTRASVEAPDSRLDTRVEVDLIKNLGLEIGYVDRSRTLEGWTVLDETFFQTLSFSNTDPKNISALLRSESAMKRDATTLEATITTRDLGALRLWATWARTDEDLTITPDVAEIVVAGGQGGAFDRSVSDYSAGVAINLAPVKVSLDYRHKAADKIVLRTDFLDQDRWRLRVDVSQGTLLRVLGTIERIEAGNPRSGFAYDASTQHFAVDLHVTPLEALTVRLGVGAYTTDSAMRIRRPQDFQLEDSIYSEDGRSLDGGVMLKVGKLSFDGGYSRFRNEGTFAFDLDRTYATLGFEISGGVGVMAQYDTRKYDEKALALANFDATRYGVFLRYQK